jgi:hypothetical protein
MNSFVSILVVEKPNFELGDIMSACCSRRYRHIKCEEFCNKNRISKQIWNEHTFEFRLERISRYEAIKTNLWTGETKKVDRSTIDIPQYLKWIRDHKKDCIIFGIDGKEGKEGKEVLYGGKVKVTHSRIDAVWDSLMVKFKIKECECTFYPFTKSNRQQLVEVIDFDDKRACELIQPLKIKGKVVKQRKFYIPKGRETTLIYEKLTSG